MFVHHIYEIGTFGAFRNKIGKEKVSNTKLIKVFLLQQKFSLHSKYFLCTFQHKCQYQQNIYELMAAGIMDNIPLKECAFCS